MDEEEESEEAKAEEEVVETELETRSGDNEKKEEDKPPDCKRKRKVGLGDGWERSSPVKWRASPIGKTFASINTRGKGRKTELEIQGSPESINQSKEGSKPKNSYDSSKEDSRED